MDEHLQTYNGIPVFDVPIGDFLMVIDAEANGKRLLSKNLSDESLRAFYIAERKPAFYVIFGGVRVRYPKKE